MTVGLTAILARCPCGAEHGEGNGSSLVVWLALGLFLGTWLLIRSIWNKRGITAMNKLGKVAVVVVLAAAVVAVVLVKQADKHPPEIARPAAPASASNPAAPRAGSAAASQPATASAPASASAEEPAALPRLVDLGGRQCKICVEMMPILDGLAADFAGRLDVQFFDVMAAPEIGRSFGIRLIPTQIFFDPAGDELYRHEGFWSREEILDKWKELSVDLKAPAK